MKTIFFLLTILPFLTHAQYKTQYTIALDSTGDFTSIQAAIDDCKSFPDQRITIFVKNGVYHEKIEVHAWNTILSLIGESKEGTIITYDDYFAKIDRGRNSTFFTATLFVGADDFIMENLTISNAAGEVGQAIALHIDADRVVVKNCHIIGNQDTIYLAGERKRQYFNNCLIEGTTDYIFGGATAVFGHCTLYQKKDSYITAASTPEGVKYGFVFLDCELTTETGVTNTYLGRPWRDYARTVFIRCEMGNFIHPEGWNNWGSTEKERTTYYAEGQCTGTGAKPDGRVSWSHQLTKKEISKFTLQNILSSNYDHSSNRGWYNR